MLLISSVFILRKGANSSFNLFSNRNLNSTILLAVDSGDLAVLALQDLDALLLLQRLHTSYGLSCSILRFYHATNTSRFTNTDNIEVQTGCLGEEKRRTQLIERELSGFTF